MIRPRTPRRRSLSLEAMEERICLSGVGWDGPGRGRAALTYYIANAPSSLSKAAVTVAVKAALSVWSRVAGVTFTQTFIPNRPDSIDVSFRPIDGRDGTLAETYYPDDINPSRIAGDVHFDSAERWELGNNQGGAAFDLVLVAVHEIGHSLGLDHSRVRGSVMAPTISPSQRFTGLAPSDVASILNLYARAGSATAARATSASATAAVQVAAAPSTAGDDLAGAALPGPASPPRAPWASWALRPRVTG